MKNLSVGDKIVYKSRFGYSEPKEANVIGIVTLDEKTGEESNVDAVSGNKVNSRNVILDLDNQAWCYGNQVKMWVSKEKSNN